MYSCQGSNTEQNWWACDDAIQTINDDAVYDAPIRFEGYDCIVEYKCYGKMIGKHFGLGGYDWMHHHHYILGFSIRETIEIIKTMCVDRVHGNRVEGSYLTGNEDNCAVTINYRWTGTRGGPGN